MICASCGAESAEGLNFCGHCGGRLEMAHQAPERRQLTVLFCDLVGSSTLAEQLDPEDYGTVLSSYQQTVTEAVEGHGGHIAQLLGDGVLAYFGYPVAHENGPDLAVAAAVAVIDKLEAQRHDEDPVVHVRIGVHTGPVMIDPRTDVKERRNLALGNTPNVAARLQHLAEPNTILLSEDTRRLLHTKPALCDLGKQTLKGLRRPVGIHRVEAGDPTHDVPLGVRPFSPSPMVNRERELARLCAGWKRAQAGRGGAALIVGDAGVGKSRLARHFIATTASEADVLSGHCSALRTASALFPIAAMLRAALREATPGGAGPNDTQPPDEQLVTRLRTEVVGLNLDDDVLSGLAASLRLPIDDPWFAEASSELRRRRTLLSLHEWIHARGRNQPVIVLVEDLHWSDPSTLEWLGELLDGVAEQPLFVVMTSRPESLGALDKPAVEHVQLGGLTPDHAQALIRGVAGDGALSRTVQRRLLAETDGVPLYLEEMTRGVLETVGDENSPAADDRAEPGIPSGLQALLTARLDRLQSSKPLAQWASILGRTFPISLLHAVATRLPGDFETRFNALVHAGILEREALEEGRYRFRHALFQEAAYRSLLRAERRDRHRTVAEVLVGDEAPILASADEVAHHFTEAGIAHAAARWWLRAGNEALARSENVESVAFLRRGLAAANALDSDDGAALRLHLEGSLATALTAVKGYAAAEVEVLHGSVRAHARHLGDSRDIFVSLRHTLPFYLVRAQHQRARDLGEELVEMASRLDDPALLMEARLALATACFWLGEAADSRRHARAALAHYDPEAHAGHAVEFGQDPGTLCHLYAAWSNWWLGAFTEARDHLDAALALARARAHPHNLAMALDHGCSLHLYFHEWPKARALVQEQFEISSRYGFSMWEAMAGFRRAWLDCLNGELASGMARMEGALQAFRATGAEIARPLHLAYLAHAHALAGNRDAGLKVVQEALHAATRNGENHYVAELHRLGGELALTADGGVTARARASFQQAIEMARRQSARALELRAALSWHRVARGDDRPEATATLTRVVHALDGVGEAPDLVAARTALATR